MNYHDPGKHIWTHAMQKVLNSTIQKYLVSAVKSSYRAVLMTQKVSNYFEGNCCIDKVLNKTNKRYVNLSIKVIKYYFS